MIPNRISASSYEQPQKESPLIRKLAKHFGESVKVSYHPSIGDTLDFLAFESTSGITDIDLFADNQKELNEEINYILNILRNKIKPKSINLQALNRNQSDSDYDKAASNALMNALHQPSQAQEQPN